MEHPTHCIGSACVLPDGCRFLRKHSEIIAQKWRAEPLLRQPAPSRSRKTSESTRSIGREGGVSARAPSGIRCATKQGAVWGLLHHGTGHCLRLATLRNEVQKHSGERWLRRDGEHWRSIGSTAGGRYWRGAGVVIPAQGPSSSEDGKICAPCMI